MFLQAKKGSWVLTDCATSNSLPPFKLFSLTSSIRRSITECTSSSQVKVLTSLLPLTIIGNCAL